MLKDEEIHQGKLLATTTYRSKNNLKRQLENEMRKKNIWKRILKRVVPLCIKMKFWA